VRILEYDKIKTAVGYCVLSTKYQTYLNGQFPNSCTSFIMVDYLITLTALLRSHQFGNIKQDLLLCRNTICPAWKRCCQLSL